MGKSKRLYQIYFRKIMCYNSINIPMKKGKTGWLLGPGF